MASISPASDESRPKETSSTSSSPVGQSLEITAIDGGDLSNRQNEKVHHVTEEVPTVHPASKRPASMITTTIEVGITDANNSIPSRPRASFMTYEQSIRSSYSMDYNINDPFKDTISLGNNLRTIGSSEDSSYHGYGIPQQASFIDPSTSYPQEYAYQPIDYGLYDSSLTANDHSDADTPNQTPNSRSDRPFSYNIPPSKHEKTGLNSVTVGINNAAVSRQMSLSGDNKVVKESSPGPREFSERHLSVWNRFFENALSSTSLFTQNINTLYAGNKSQEESIETMKRTPRSAWPSPMRDSEYEELVEEFFRDPSHSYDDQWINTMTIEASNKGDSDLIERLCSIEKVMYVISCRDQFGRTPLHYCAKNDNIQSMGLLLDYGADIDARDIDGRTAIHVSCIFGSHSSLQYLLQSAADGNARDKNKNTCLHFAARGGYYKCCQLLLEYDADVNALNDERQSACSLADGSHQRTEAVEEVIRLLSSHEKYLPVPVSNTKTSMRSRNTSSSSDYETNSMRRSNSHRKARPGHPRHNRTVYDEDSIVGNISDGDSKIDPNRQASLSNKSSQRRWTKRVNKKNEKGANVSWSRDVKTPQRVSQEAIIQDNFVNSFYQRADYDQDNQEFDSNPQSPWLDLKVDTSAGNMAKKRYNNAMTKPESHSQRQVLHSPAIGKDDDGLVKQYMTDLQLKMDSMDLTSPSRMNRLASYQKSKDQSDSFQDDEDRRHSDRTMSDEEDLDDSSDQEEGDGVIDRVSNFLWGFTGRLLGLSISMFQSSEKDSHSSINNIRATNMREDQYLEQQVSEKVETWRYYLFY